ncbi:hypothetical protein Acr_00g0077610 [Actinidia rufa]|uniref:CCHC-type domain-containing protein n=1 Tax=Actinidia rufa TaxID=165716 RepID=A0A7J0DTA8_9ERIC|nr:hypothetical protein Acr_00g0077610 [Actinidia rufa]
MKATINSQFSIERFNGNSSFTLWQRKVKDILVQQGLAKALKGKDAKPETMKDDDWEELMMKCVSTIRLCIADNIINNVMDEDSASALWEKLEKLYLAKSLTNKLHLKRQLYRLKMEEGGNLMEHMNVFNGYLDQLRKVDVKIDEEDKALLLLTSLPNSYDTLVTTLLYEKDTVSLEQVQSSLVSHCTQKRSGWSNGSSSSSRGKGVQCYYCKEFGHVKRDCPLRKDKGKKCDDASSCNSLVVADDGYCLTVSEVIVSSLVECDHALEILTKVEIVGIGSNFSNWLVFYCGQVIVFYCGWVIVFYYGWVIVFYCGWVMVFYCGWVMVFDCG